ncbi:PLP-dependent aminotransferase family protein [Streptomyces sp. AJS327]|uniref:MocR-like pyridoxine biosynthesis transcription factor PdxR n=1 Tax=Streptomyces sp. AJS327 TaxID=2545265 RepID=UPI0015DFE0FA|nr:PLP-dependent aminotransferase family protein [Streptomyces sp. AJS327]MBA0049737.1 PLP-dependent aminotransferase family protein [Streptomyces sp. AJS327]
MERSNEGPPHQSIRAGSDFLHLAIDEAPSGRKSEWLTQRIRLALADGRLPVGSRLPATRVLASDLGVSRGVVTEAYQRLIEDGHLAGRGRGGTVVVGAPLTTAATTPSTPPPPPSPPSVFAAAPHADVFDVLRTAPARIDLSPGLPDLAAFPRAAWLRAERRVLDRLAASDLGYGDPRGTPALRAAVANWIARNRGIRADPDEVLVVAGTAQTLTLVGRVLRGDGVSAVAMEDPGSLGARQHLRACQVNTPPVAVDSEGVRVDELRATGAAAVLLTPAHQFPTGVVLRGGRRGELTRWARESGGLVIEDDYDAEHRYDRAPVPALRSVLTENVFYAGSVSKLLAPALRVGWLLAPPRYRDALVDAKRFADLGNAALPQLVLAQFMESGAMERQLRHLRGHHRRRRDVMVEAVGTHLPGAIVHGTAAGLHLTVTFEAGFADTDVAAAALARGVKVHPLSWHCQRPRQPGLVLGYAASSPADISEGVATLGDVLRQLP